MSTVKIEAFIMTLKTYARYENLMWNDKLTFFSKYITKTISNLN